MKKITATKMIKKALGATLAAAIAWGSAFVAMPVIQTHAAEASSGVKSVQTESVDMALGLSGLRDPVKHTGDSGDSYVPSDYIYLGNNNRGAMLWRVLSSGTDNLGNPGATFVMSEYLETASFSGKNYDEAYLSYFTDTEKAVFLPYASGEGKNASAFGKEWTENVPAGVLFAPSASDVANYVASYSGAPTLRAYTDASRATAGNWWLRSEADGGVGYVTAAGVVDTETNLSLVSNYNRIAANLDLSNVTFSTRVDGGWRLALLDTDYVEDDRFDFAAWITDIDGAVIEISYVNAKPKDVSDAIGECISVMVVDAEGNVKHYEQLGEVQSTETVNTHAYKYEEGVGYTMLSPGEYYSFQGWVSFDTTGVYDNEAGDRMYVFWEKAYDSRSIDSDPTLAYQTTTTSKLVEVCWHEENPELPATCWRLAECAICGTSYGEYNIYDISAHVDGDGNSGIKWDQRLGIYRGEDGFFKDAWIHTGHCELCDHFLPIDENGYEGSPEPCYCEGAEVDCSNGATCDVCGGYFVDPMMHSYDQNGICNRNAHFEEPELVDGAYQIKTVGNLLWYSDYTNREEFVGDSDMAGAVLMNDIDFSVLNAEKYGDKYKDSNWTPIGSAEYAVDADEDGEVDGEYPVQFNAVFDGNGYVIKNIHCVSDKYESIGLIGYAQGASKKYPEVKNLGLVDCYFENTSSEQRGNAAIVGSSGDACTIENCYVKNTTVIGDGYVGGIIGYAMYGNGVKNCYAVDLTLRESGETVYSWIARYASAGAPSYCFAYGENAGLLGKSGSGLHMGTYTDKGYACYYLNENGTLDSDDDRKTAEQFASGLVAFYLRSGYGQTLGEHSYPVLNGDKVYRVEVCGGEGANRYAYSNVDKVEHVWDNVHTCGEAKTCVNCGEKFGEALDHEYTSIKGNESFIWAEDGSYDSCKVQTYCAHCDLENPELLNATVNFNFNGGVRADYVASIILGENRYTSDVIHIPIITIDEATGITPSSNIFTGSDYLASDLVTNTKMRPDEYEAYFLLDGEMVGEYARDAGVYDLHIVGRGRYEYQEYTYEDFFTIEKVEVEMTVSVKDKIVDGTQDFEFDVTFSNGVDYSYILGIFADQYELPSAEVGEYEITGIGIYFYYDGDENNITITHNETAIARILPRNYVVIENNSYELDYEYGETVPEPLASDFTVDEGSEITFTWFKDGVLLRETPQKSGSYTLRVTASATDEYIGSVAEYTVTVQPKLLDIVIDPFGECETETEDLGYDWDDDGKNDTRTWYLVEMGETIPIYVVGMPGIDEPVSIHDERFASTGFYLYWNLYEAGAGVRDVEGEDLFKLFPKVPNEEGYRLNAYTHSENTFGVSTEVGFAENYRIEFYFKIKSPLAEMKPVGDTVEHTGGIKTPYAILNIPKWEFSTKPFEDWYYIPNFDIIYRTDISADASFSSVDRDYSSIEKYYEMGTMVQSIPITMNEEYYIRVNASYDFTATNYDDYGNASHYNFEDEQEVLRAKVTVEIYDQFGDMIDEIRDVGNYTVSITTQKIDESGNTVGEATKYTAAYRVKGATRDVYLLVKETEIELDGAVPEYDVKDIVFLPGYTLAPGHKIVDLTYAIQLGGYMGAFNMGVVTVSDWVIVDEDGNDVSDEYVVHSKLYEWKEKYEEVYGKDFENTKNHTVVHAYSNACDATCNIDNCSKTREVQPHKGGKATCTTLAICEACGSEYGGYDYTNHSGDKTVYVRNPDDFRYHDEAYACCGTVISTEEHTIIKAATCTTLAECELCGTVEGSYDATNHSSDEMYYATNPDDATKHDHMHKCCDKVESTGEHKGGVASCTSLALCDVCKLGYGELDAKNHSSDEYKYEIISDGASRHNASHACCGAYVGAEDHFGGEAICTSGAICEGCGAEYGDVNPDNHASDEYRYSPASVGNKHYVYNACCGAEVKTEEHSGGHATCKDKATCEKCGVEYGETDPASHASDDVSHTVNAKDPTKHDATCKSCGALVETVAHSGGKATCTTLAECELCKAAYGELGVHTYTDPCDADCEVCGAERLPGHVDADKDRYCDVCEKELYAASGETETEDGTESEVESGDPSESGSENTSESETEDISESESEDTSETESEKVDETESEGSKSETPGGTDGGKKGCKSSIGAGALTVIVSVALAGFALIKRKKES